MVNVYLSNKITQVYELKALETEFSKEYYIISKIILQVIPAAFFVFYQQTSFVKRKCEIQYSDNNMGLKINYVCSE